MTLRPTAVEPVKTIWSKASALKAPASSRGSVTRATSSSAKISASIRRNTAAVAGLSSAILIITRLPAASAAASGPMAR
jgi:hypothetical protein